MAKELVKFLGEKDIDYEQRLELHLLIANGGVPAAEAVIEHTAYTGAEDECGAVIQLFPNDVKTFLRRKYMAMTALHPAFR